MERIRTILRALSEADFGTGRGRFRCFTPADIVTILVADRMITEGVRPARVRDACRYLREKLRVTGPPLTGHTFFTDGTTVLVNTANPDAVVDVARQGQLVFAMALHDIAVVCEEGGFLPTPQPRLARVEARVTMRWPTATAPPMASGDVA
ncbi:MAG: hypothetical protein HY682_11765 [Chloroflexi bacterium]|nr:hypothetical protein [Chloroflexota bacterium]